VWQWDVACGGRGGSGRARRPGVGSARQYSGAGRRGQSRRRAGRAGGSLTGAAPFFPPPSQAAWGAVRAYVQLHDARGAGAGGDADDDAALAGLSAEDRKKEKLRRKKEEKRLAKEAADRAAAAEEARRAAEREGSGGGGGKDKGGKKKAARCAGGAG
jgi:hypothetical protein